MNDLEYRANELILILQDMLEHPFHTFFQRTVVAAAYSQCENYAKTSAGGILNPQFDAKCLTEIQKACVSVRNQTFNQSTVQRFLGTVISKNPTLVKTLDHLYKLKMSLFGLKFSNRPVDHSERFFRKCLYFMGNKFAQNAAVLHIHCSVSEQIERKETAVRFVCDCIRQACSALLSLEKAVAKPFDYESGSNQTVIELRQQVHYLQQQIHQYIHPANHKRYQMPTQPPFYNNNSYNSSQSSRSNYQNNNYNRKFPNRFPAQSYHDDNEDGDDDECDEYDPENEHNEVYMPEEEEEENGDDNDMDTDDGYRYFDYSNYSCPPQFQSSVSHDNSLRTKPQSTHIKSYEYSPLPDTSSSSSSQESKVPSQSSASSVGTRADDWYGDDNDLDSMSYVPLPSGDSKSIDYFADIPWPSSTSNSQFSASTNVVTDSSTSSNNFNPFVPSTEFSDVAGISTVMN